MIATKPKSPKGSKTTSNKNDVSIKKLYVRQFSNVIRKWSSSSGLSMQENPIVTLIGPNRTIVLTICRIRQRILSHAWQIWIERTGVKHDYEADVRMILSRKIPEDDFRTELEIEVLYKWIVQVKDIDPTGIASTIFQCKRKAVIYEALQQIRLEFYAPGETVLIQGDIPRPEDGHFTIFKGECEVVQFPEESVPLLKLLYLAKKKRWDEAKKLLRAAQIVAKIPHLSGFGELSTLTGVKRAASIRAARKLESTTEILVLPKEPLLNCLKMRYSDGVSGSATSEAIDFLRQSGLANRISPKDLVSAAASMIRRTLLQGDILYYKGESVKSIFLVVSGELLLDTADCIFDGIPTPFVHTTLEKCFHLSSGSILGDEGVTGHSSIFESTAVVVSSAAVVFEAVGFGMRFLADKIGTLRYSALFYRDKLRFDYSYELAEQMNIYTYFNSLRKCIAYTKPFRGTSHGHADLSSQNNKSTSASPNSPSKSPSRPTSRQQRLIQERTKALQIKDSRVSFLLENDGGKLAATVENFLVSSDDSIVYDVPKILHGLGLHRAIEMNKQAKKLLQQGIKLHAKDTILYEQLRKMPKEDDEVDEQEDEDKRISERAFRKSLKEYLERVAERNKRIKEEEEAERQRKLARGSTAVKFFSAATARDGDDESLSVSKGNGEAPIEAHDRKDSMVSVQSDETDNSNPHRRKMLVQEHQISKMEQYFIWVDALNRQSYRHLMHQAQVTAAELHDHQIHETPSFSTGETAVTAKTWQELAEVFETFGLTPQDMNIPWQSTRIGSPQSAAASRMTTPSGKLKPVTPMLPLEKLKSRSGSEKFDKVALERGISLKSMGRIESSTSLSSKKGEEEASVKKILKADKKGKRKRSVIDPHNQNPHIAVSLGDKTRLESKFKSYTPSSWRDDLIQQKAQELSQVQQKFLRLDTPDNRRTVDLHIKISPHFDVDDCHIPEKVETVLPQDDPLHLKAAEPDVLEKSFDDYLKDVDFEKYLEDPSYFLRIVIDADMSEKRRINTKTKAWQTRYMNIGNSTRNYVPPALPLVDSVRTHLQENLDGYSKVELLKSVERMRRNQTTQFMTIINDGCSEYEEFNYNRNRNFSVANIDRNAVSTWYMESADNKGSSDEKGGTLSDIEIREESEPFHPVIDGFIGHNTDDQSVQSIKTVSTTEREYQREILEAIPPISCDSLPPLVQEIGPNMNSLVPDGIAEGNSKGLVESPSPPSPQLGDRDIKLPLISVVQSKSSSPPSTDDLPKHLQTIENLPEVPNSNTKYSDARQPSKALQAFEEFLKTEQQNGNAKAVAEGRRRANKNSKFKLKKTEDNYINTVNFSRVHKSLFETEMALFVSMYPKANEQQKMLFIESFQRKYPDVKIESTVKQLQEDSITIDYASANSNISIHSLDSASKDSKGTVELIGGKLIKLASKKKLDEDFENDGNHTEHDMEYEADPELEKWQRFTIGSLVDQKNGERKEFPSVSLGKLQVLETLGGKRFRNRHKIGAGFVTFPPKHTEESIEGPPSYLELYKTSFKIYTNSKDKARVLEDLRVRKASELSLCN